MTLRGFRSSVHIKQNNFEMIVLQVYVFVDRNHGAANEPKYPRSEQWLKAGMQTGSL